MDVTHEGNFFCFAFIRNKANTEPNTGREAPRSLGIFITTQNPNPVGYRIRSDNTGYSRTGTVTAGTIIREQYMTPNVPEVNTATTSVGIIVETINSSQTIQVMGFSDSFGNADGFLAVPIIQYKSNFTYGYASLSASARSFNSIVAVVACGDIAEDDVTPSFTRYAIVRQLSDDRITRETRSNSNTARAMFIYIYIYIYTYIHTYIYNITVKMID